MSSKILFRRAFAQRKRMAELAFEDHRFWDIRRWKIGPESVTIKRVTVTKAVTVICLIYTSTSDRIWEDKMYFYPIPQSEMYKIVI